VLREGRTADQTIYLSGNVINEVKRGCIPLYDALLVHECFAKRGGLNGALNAPKRCIWPSLPRTPSKVFLVQCHNCTVYIQLERLPPLVEEATLPLLQDFAFRADASQ
jgi:hypothetical protein